MDTYKATVDHFKDPLYFAKGCQDQEGEGSCQETAQGSRAEPPSA